jgi:hypothetical protein
MILTKWYITVDTVVPEKGIGCVSKLDMEIRIRYFQYVDELTFSMIDGYNIGDK